MLLPNTIETLEGLSEGKGVDQLQRIFNGIISELSEFLDVAPLYDELIVELGDKNKETEKYILDFGVDRSIQNKRLEVEIYENNLKHIPFILVREVYYSFVDNQASTYVKICINQIVENTLSKLSALKEWKGKLRDVLVDKDFILAQLDRLEKFFKMKGATQSFIKDMRENLILCRANKPITFYDIIFEKFTYKTSKSLFNEEIVETLRILFYIFLENKSYITLTEYQDLFKKFKQSGRIETTLSLRKFSENMQWINKATSIAPTYDIDFGAIEYYPLLIHIKFNPLLNRYHIEQLMEKWPFYYVSRVIENGLSTERLISCLIPKPVLNDFLTYFSQLQEFGYLKKKMYRYLDKISNFNLNYFTDLSNVRRIIDPTQVQYDANLEVELSFNYTEPSQPRLLSLLDFIILDRLRYLSITGLTFDKRVETLNFIKQDIETEKRKQESFIVSFERSLERISSLPQRNQQFVQLLETNKEQGFLYSYYHLAEVVKVLTIFNRFLETHLEVSNSQQLHTLITSGQISQNIEELHLIQNKRVSKIIFRDYVSLYFQSHKEFGKRLEELQLYLTFLDACYNLRIVDLNKIKEMVNSPKKAENVYKIREKKNSVIFKSVSSYKITNELIDSVIDTFSNYNPPLIFPMLINTIFSSSFAKYYPNIFLRDTLEVRNKINTLKKYFPRIVINTLSDFSSNQKVLYLNTYFININEKRLFLSALYSMFTDSFIIGKRVFYRGHDKSPGVELRDFYDFSRKQLYEPNNIFRQLSLYSRSVLGDRLEWSTYPSAKDVNHLFWDKEQDILRVVNDVKYRVARQQTDFNKNELTNLTEFMERIENILLNLDKFKEIKVKKFFTRYIHKIKFVPAFQRFGFSQYCLYFRPFYYASPEFEIDFKLLFLNSFQKIKYPASVEPNPLLFNEYIFPFQTPNKAYLNRLTKSKRIVAEYCLFSKTKFYEIVNFDRNITEEGWNYSSLRFKSYMQNILFDPNYHPEIQGIRTFDLNERFDTNIYGLNTDEYNFLTLIYNTRSLDIKSYLGTNKLTILNAILTLLKRKVIFPYISLKNLDFQDKVTFILPNTTQEITEKLIKIFCFFNWCHIYEIEGELFIHGFQEEKTFESGVMIKVWFPKCELDEFLTIFHQLFQYLEIEHYITLTDLVKGDILLQSIYGNLDILREYNPLKNLIWNEKDKKWMNHKLYTEKMEKLYPDLFYEKGE